MRNVDPRTPRDEGPRNRKTSSLKGRTMTDPSNKRRPFTRDALRHLEDQGRAHYDGTHWHAVHTDTGERG